MMTANAEHSERAQECATDSGRVDYLHKDKKASWKCPIESQEGKKKLASTLHFEWAKTELLQG